MAMENLPNLSKLIPDEKDKLIFELFTTVGKLQLRIKELEGRLSKNSQNSSKPPSSDGFNKPDPKSQRKKSNRKTGGQSGHPGTTLDPVENPDFIEKYKVECCKHCQASIKNDEPSEVEKRQEFDIPPASMQVTEHQAYTTICPKCGEINKGEFPSHVTQPVQYGPRARATMVYYSQNQLLPYKRLQNVFRDIHNLPLSEGTLYNTNEMCYEKLENFETTVKEQIKNSSLSHFDESGLRVKKKLYWLHVASTDKLTHFEAHEKRGSEAMDEIGILPDFKGWAVHDHWSPYFKYNCKHALCNAHHLRELTYHNEHYEQEWCQKIQVHLLKIKAESTKQKELEKEEFTSEKLLEFQKTYHLILQEGLKEIPVIEVEPKKRGKKKQHPSKNLWDRLSNDHFETLAFMYDFTVPFTNNQGERDIRMSKIKQKISGCFRSLKGAKIFCRNRGYISTVKKQGQNVIDALVDVFKGTPFIPSPPEIEINNTS